jgi:hypothetical protein
MHIVQIDLSAFPLQNLIMPGLALAPPSSFYPRGMTVCASRWSKKLDTRVNYMAVLILLVAEGYQACSTTGSGS